MKHYIYKTLTLILALVLCAPLAPAQTKKKAKEQPVTISGNVVNEKGLPMMGVRITVQDSFIDTESDEFGDFTITVPSIGAVLVFNTDYYYELQQTVTSAEGFYRIVLKEAPAGQGTYDVVRMPYRDTKKRDLNASIFTVGSEELDKSKVTSLGNALSGRVLGMTSRQYAGQPGSDEATYRIRGVRTLFGGNTNGVSCYGVSTPLIIVDGFERTFDDLDANEIESFSVLKDAAATAIYGIRGANGVILVTTKRGFTNKRTIEVKYNEGILSPLDCFPDYVDSYRFASWYNEALVNDGKSPIYTEQDLALYQTGQSPLTHPNVDFYDEVFNKYASQRKASITMSGGNQIARYFVLLGYTFQDGLYKYQDFNPDFSTKTNFSKINARANLDISLAKWLTVSTTISGRIMEQKYPYYSSSYSTFAGEILDVCHTPPNAYPVSFTGIDPDLQQEAFMLGGNAEYDSNPLGLLAFRGYNERTYRYYQITGRAKADLSEFVTPGLTVEFAGHLDGYNSYRVEKSRSFRVWSYSQNAAGDDVYTPYGTETSLSSSGAYGTTRYYGVDAEIKYNRVLGDHAFNAMAAWNRRLEVLASNNKSDYRTENIALWASYGFKNRYFLDLTACLSGSEKFYQTDTPRTLFPAVAASWVISGENFMKEARFVDYLKLRASAGISGNSEYSFTDINGDDERYPARERWWISGTSSGYLHFGTAATAMTLAYEGRMANPDAVIEKAAMFNLALEGTLFNHQLDFDLEGWFERRYDAYTAAVGTYPKVLGVLDDRMPITNDGIVHSAGVEFMLNWHRQIGKFKYSILGQISYNDNKIIEMGEPYREYENLWQTGNRTRMDYGLHFLGFFKDQADVDNSPVQNLGAYGIGDMKYEDVNGDGVVDTNDFVPIGNGRDPRLSAGLNLNIEYAGFGIDVLLQGTALQTNFLNMDSMRAFYYDTTKKVISTAQNWMEGRVVINPDGTSNAATATYPKFSLGTYQENNYRASDFWMADASYFRIKNIALSYTFPKKWLRGVALDNVKVYLNAYNPFTFSYMSKYHLDPEDWLAGSSRYPQTKLYSVGIDLTF